MSETNGSVMYDAFHISEQKEGKAKWHPIGVAFTNRDQSINLYLEALPIDGKVQLRDRKSNQQTKGETK